jgi:deoxyribodipyrimidine photolyase-related protein
MILGNFAAQRGWLPEELTDWYHRSFVDGYDWVVVPNVVGMSQHADLGIMATKPYVAGGAISTRRPTTATAAVRPEDPVGDDAVPSPRLLVVLSRIAHACKAIHA